VKRIPAEYSNSDLFLRAAILQAEFTCQAQSAIFPSRDSLHARYLEKFRGSAFRLKPIRVASTLHCRSNPEFYSADDGAAKERIQRKGAIAFNGR
jgi:hypothetical protein